MGTHKAYTEYTVIEPEIPESSIHPIRPVDEPKIPESSIHSTAPEKRGAPVRNVRYLQLIRAVFNPEASANERCHTLALAAISSGSRTSSIAAGLGEELTCFSGDSTVVVDALNLRYLHDIDTDGIIQSCQRSLIPNLWRLKPSRRQTAPLQPQPVNGKAPTRWRVAPFYPGFLGQCVRALGNTFGYVLLDCPPLSVSPEALILAPMVDGIVLVIEAERDTRKQINSARKMIEMSGGRVLGFVLSNRQYPIPYSIFKWLL